MANTGAMVADSLAERNVHAQHLRNRYPRLTENAPELLEALQGILSAVSVRIDDPRVSLFDTARAVVAKATA